VSSPCQLETLVKSATTHIQYCSDCEEVHISLGPISLRLSRDHYQRFSSDIAKGLYHLEMPNLSSEMLHDRGARTLQS
jgi:hypothetical protein